MSSASVLTNGSGEAPIHAALHALAQPLTALSFILELAMHQSDPDAVRQSLLDASQECRRAVAAMSRVRDEAHALLEEAQ